MSITNNCVRSDLGVDMFKSPPRVVNCMKIEAECLPPDRKGPMPITDNCTRGGPSRHVFKSPPRVANFTYVEVGRLPSDVTLYRLQNDVIRDTLNSNHSGRDDKGEIWNSFNRTNNNNNNDDNNNNATRARNSGGSRKGKRATSSSNRSNSEGWKENSVNRTNSNSYRNRDSKRTRKPVVTTQKSTRKSIDADNNGEMIAVAIKYADEHSEKDECCDSDDDYELTIYPETQQKLLVESKSRTDMKGEFIESDKSEKTPESKTSEMKFETTCPDCGVALEKSLTSSAQATKEQSSTERSQFCDKCSPLYTSANRRQIFHELGEMFGSRRRHRSADERRTETGKTRARHQSD